MRSTVARRSAGSAGTTADTTVSPSGTDLATTSGMRRGHHRGGTDLPARRPPPSPGRRARGARPSTGPASRSCSSTTRPPTALPECSASWRPPRRCSSERSGATSTADRRRPATTVGGPRQRTSWPSSTTTAPPTPAGWPPSTRAFTRNDRLGVVQGRTRAADGPRGQWTIAREISRRDALVRGLQHRLPPRRRSRPRAASTRRSAGTARTPPPGWKVVEAGWERDFEGDAVVVHDLEERGVRWRIRHGWLETNLVRLAGRHPGLRAGLWRRWAFRSQSVTLPVALAAAVLAALVAAGGGRRTAVLRQPPRPPAPARRPPGHGGRRRRVHRRPRPRLGARPGAGALAGGHRARGVRRGVDVSAARAVAPPRRRARGADPRARAASR